MRIFFKIFSFFLIAGLCFLSAKYLWARFVKGQNKDINTILGEAKNDVLSSDGFLGNVLGEATNNDDLGRYLRQQLPEDIQTQVKESEVVKQVQTEITTIVNQTTQEVKDLPAQQTEKLKKEVAEEICRQLLNEDEQN